MKKQKLKLRVGDWVSFPFGLQTMIAQIVEDRGHLGVGGRRILRIRPFGASGDENDFEMPEEEVTPTEAPVITDTNRVQRA